MYGSIHSAAGGKPPRPSAVLVQIDSSEWNRNAQPPPPSEPPPPPGSGSASGSQEDMGGAHSRPRALVPGAHSSWNQGGGIVPHKDHQAEASSASPPADDDMELW